MAVNRKRSLYASNKFPELPQGGEAGDVIIKTSPYDGAAAWAPAPMGMPVGAVMPYAGKTVELPWVPCDGRWYAREELPELYDMMLADAFPYGGDATQERFAVPNMSGRTVVGSGTGYDIGVAGGTSAVTLTANQSGLRTHSHGMNGAGYHSHSGWTDVQGHHGHGANTVHPFVGGSGGGGQTGLVYQGGWTGNYGLQGIAVHGAGEHAHNVGTHAVGDHTHGIHNNGPWNAAESHTNMQPYMPLNYIILAFGGYTPDDAIPEPDDPVPAMFDRSVFDEADPFSRQSAVILT